MHRYPGEARANLILAPHAGSAPAGAISAPANIEDAVFNDGMAMLAEGIQS